MNSFTLPLGFLPFTQVTVKISLYVLTASTFLSPFKLKICCCQKQYFKLPAPLVLRLNTGAWYTETPAHLSRLTSPCSASHSELQPLKLEQVLKFPWGWLSSSTFVPAIPWPETLSLPSAQSGSYSSFRTQARNLGSRSGKPSLAPSNLGCYLSHKLPTG